MAVEVVSGRYLFGDPNAETEMTWLHNPLHDYESIWWIAVWFVFHSSPNGVAEGVMEEARSILYKGRTATFGLSGFNSVRLALPKELRDLGRVLNKMKLVLVEAYMSFEKSFEGSKMLDVYQDLRPHLEGMVEAARGLTARPKHLGGRLKEETGFVVAAPGEEDQQTAERGEEAQRVEDDDPFLGSDVVGSRDSELRKRKRISFELPLETQPRRKKFDDE
jgi:hypothetical protein